MSHNLIRHSILCNARVRDFLKRVDATEAAACRVAGCLRCGGVLHSATYPRKPHGLAADLRDDVRRFSLCCSVCRRRVQPASVRFFERRFTNSTAWARFPDLASSAPSDQPVLTGLERGG